MKTLTARQQQILDFIQNTQQVLGVAPSFKDIARQFGFRSLTTVADHLRLLRRKGAIEAQPGRARALKVLTRMEPWRQPVADIPLFGAIPAGPPRERLQEAQGCVSVDVQSLGFKPTARTFALQVRGDSMIGRHILDGDIVMLEHGVSPRNGDIVAALIDNESTLKTFVLERGRAYLRAENPRYPALVPAQELVIQGVMMALVRKRTSGH